MMKGVTDHNGMPASLTRSGTLRSLSTAASGETMDSGATTASNDSHDHAAVIREYAVPVVIRNTFLDVLAERPVSLDGFYEERQVKSEPASTIDDPAAEPYLPGGGNDADKAVLCLSEALVAPVLGSKDLPTIGSQGHHIGNCKPCAFVHREEGCGNGVQCKFCHICGPGEKKRRAKEKKENRKNSSRLRQAMVGFGQFFR
mmetsp:Transcript_42201/g.99026  ORF Transcript_42201/g.99026 Transcript_42201/m.99026 type:complete len:201 (-) Transcript_42201:106-708(-)